MHTLRLKKNLPAFNLLRFISWSVKKAQNDLLVSFSLELSTKDHAHKVQFAPEVTLQGLASDFFALTPKVQANTIFNLGLAELVSYWKTSCPNQIEILAEHYYSQNQATALLKWWHSVFIFGLGEFFYVNKITDFKNSGFINWKLNFSKPLSNESKTNDATNTNFERLQTTNKSKVNKQSLYVGESLSEVKKYLNQIESEKIRDRTGEKSILIPVGGGKDSALTVTFFEWLKTKQNLKDIKLLLLNPTASAMRVASKSKFKVIKVSRNLDPKLLELNHKGYLNGHTPFSAYLAVLSQVVSVILDLDEVVLSNESSADEGNLSFNGLEINHQYSKSTTFEKAFRYYSKKFLSNSADYYSLLRPLFEIQIASLVAQTKYRNLTLSCNKGGRSDRWCGQCSKCLFTYLLLYPHFLKQVIAESNQEGEFSKKVESFLENKSSQKKYQTKMFEEYSTLTKAMSKRASVFELDLFSKKSQIPTLQQLLGVADHKPLDCVGLYQETLVSTWQATQLLEKTFNQKIETFQEGELEVLKWFKAQILTKHDPNQLNFEWAAMNSHWNKVNYLPKWIKLHFQNWVKISKT
jgi:hypothetical protein